MQRFFLCWAAALLVGLPVPALAAETPAERLRAIADVEHPQREQAEAWWEALTPERQVVVLRAALHREDPDVALIAAASLGYPYLDAAELRRSQALLHARPAWMFAPPKTLNTLQRLDRQGFGGPDVLPYFRAAAEDPSIDSPDTLTSAHRCLRTEHVDALAPLLERGTPAFFEDLLWSVGQIGEHDRRDRRRAIVARGLLYGLRRLRAERAARTPPRWKDVQAAVESRPGGGLPAAYVEIAAASFPDAATGFLAGGKAGDTLSIEPPFHWLRRWTLSLEPEPADAALLQRFVEVSTAPPGAFSPFGPAHLLWAMRGLCGPAAQRERVLAWAAGADKRACFAAAALAEHGAPEAFVRLCGLAEAGELFEGAAGELADLSWRVQRTAARRRAVEALAAEDPAELGARHFLSAESRMWMERTQDIRIDDSDLAAIEEELWRRKVHARTLLWWHAQIRPGRLKPERALDLILRLGKLPALREERPSLERYDAALAELEGLRPQATRALLLTWLGSQPALREDVVVRLARLGVTGHAKDLCAPWPDAYDEHAWVLGRVRSEDVRAFLQTQADDPDPEVVLRALQAGLVHAGLPGAAVHELTSLRYRGDDAEPALETLVAQARTTLRAGDAVGALLGLAKPLGAYPGLGRVEDERVRVWLRAQQARRDEGRWWSATAALAVGGDAHARAALSVLLADDRTWILDQFEGFDLGAERDLTDLLLERLDSNCCLGWAAHEVLQRIYPTLPFDSGFGGAGTERTRAWLAAFRWERSALLEGWVPLRP